MLQSILPVRIYYEDTDAIGIIYHSNYLKYFERGRVEWFRAQGIDLKSLRAEYEVQFVVHSLQIKYLQPAYLDQLLYIVTKVTAVNFASIRYNQRVHLGESDGPLICEGDVRVAAIKSNQQATRLPKILVREFKK